MDVGDLSDRFQLRKDLQCEDFQWYLTNIYPELYAPPKEDIILNGEVFLFNFLFKNICLIKILDKIKVFFINFFHKKI